MHIRRVSALAVTAALGLLLAGCGSLGRSTVSTSAANTAAAAAGGRGAASAPSAKKAAGLGDTIDVTGMTNGEKLAVTLVKIDTKAQATDGFSTPTAGDGYFAAQVQIKNIGTAAYTDSLDNCMIVKDGKGQQFQPDLLDSISSGPMLDQLTLAAGDSSLGWIVFDVPVGDSVAEVQFTEDSGMGGDTAQWSL